MVSDVFTSARGRRLAVGLVALIAGLIGLLAGSSVASAAPGPTARAASAGQSVWSVDASRGIQELLGSGDGSVVGWNRATGLWGGSAGSYWWQSAVALSTLLRYAEQTNDLSSAIQNVLLRTYSLNSRAGVSQGQNFTNRFMDDTAWWGLAWLDASQYELYYRHDQPDASRFLAVAEWDASYIAGQPRPCGGIEWNVGSAPDTITNAEFVSLTAALARYRQAPGIFHDAHRAASWLADAQADLNWLEQSGLLNMSTGQVAKDSLSSSSCQHRLGGPVTYTQGEVAEALVQMGSALGQGSYFSQAAAFLQYAINPTNGFVLNGVLQDHCEAQAPNCQGNANQTDVPAFKGIFMQALSDWSSATGSTEFQSFAQAQATAVISNDILGGALQPPGCGSPHGCQFGLSWARQLSPMLVTVGTQASALSALSAMLP